jgi:CHASE3 domain sensor protein
MNILDPEEPQRSQEFLDAFHYAQQGTGRRFQLGKLAFLHRDPKYYESIKVAHAFADYYVEKAIQYRKKTLEKGSARIDKSTGDVSGRQNVVLLHDMALETNDRVDLRNQIMHGK